MKGRLIGRNPFAGHKSSVTSNRERMVFVNRDTVQRVLDACPNAKWRAVVSRCPFGGLRSMAQALESHPLHRQGSSPVVRRSLPLAHAFKMLCSFISRESPRAASPRTATLG